MRTWIRKHHIGVFSLAALTLAGLGAVLLLFYFNYCFTLKWASALGWVAA